MRAWIESYPPYKPERVEPLGACAGGLVLPAGKELPCRSLRPNLGNSGAIPSGMLVFKVCYSVVVVVAKQMLRSCLLVVFGEVTADQASSFYMLLRGRAV